MAIEYQLFDSAEAYRPRIPEVAQLFSTVFQRAFPAETWGQWYLDNPYGDPHVALGYHGDQLVGHHALVPQELVGQGGQRLRYLLSVSLMVHPRFRKLSVFMGMVDALHRLALEEGAPFILAFPNAQAAPLWEKVYSYRPLVQTELCNWRPPDSSLAGMGSLGEMRSKPQCCCPEDSVYWNWRTQKNHARACTAGGTLHLVYKVIEPATLMLLDARVEGERNAAECLARLANGLGLAEIRLTRHHAARLGIPDASLIPHEGYVVRFFGFPLAEGIPDIRFSLLLSDVF
jgi:GNAT superfamily N-acetyltransferase